MRLRMTGLPALVVATAAILVLAGCAQVNLPVVTPAAPAAPTAQPAAEAPSITAGDTAVATATQDTAADAASDTGGVSCSGALTSPNMEGPYYTAGAPQRDSLIDAGMPGVPILIFGHVYDRNCNPIGGAKVDFWQADANGVYDNVGYTLRGHVLADENGGYAVETIVPGVYPGRPPHIHVKVFAPDGRELLTTQLYFAGSENSGDVRAAPDLLVAFQGLDENGRQRAPFDFVVSR